MAVSDEMAFSAQREAAAAEGVLICPEGGACLAALRPLRERGDLEAGERVVLFNTASALKHPEAAPAAPPAGGAEPR